MPEEKDPKYKPREQNDEKQGGETVGMRFQRDGRGITFHRTRYMTIIRGHAAQNGMPLILHVEGNFMDHTIKCLQIADMKKPVFGSGVTEALIATDGNASRYALRETVPEILQAFEAAGIAFVKPKVELMSRASKFYWLMKRMSGVSIGSGQVEPVLPGTIPGTEVKRPDSALRPD